MLKRVCVGAHTVTSCIVNRNIQQLINYRFSEYIIFSSNTARIICTKMPTYLILSKYTDIVETDRLM